jgi:hypothetical protein
MLLGEPMSLLTRYIRRLVASSGVAGRFIVLHRQLALVLGVAVAVGVFATPRVPAFKTDNGAPGKALTTKAQKVSYALGVNLAGQLRSQLVDVEPDVLTRGLRDALAGSKTLLSDTEVRAALKEMQLDSKAKRDALRHARSQLRHQNAGDAPLSPDDLAKRAAVMFKLDPRLASGVYGGERWVAPPVYTRVGNDKSCTIDAKAPHFDRPTWTASDPEMVTITPINASDVQIVVRRPGESTIRVDSNGISKTLKVKAEYRNNVLEVEIAQ